MHLKTIPAEMKKEKRRQRKRRRDTFFANKKEEVRSLSLLKRVCCYKRKGMIVCNGNGKQMRKIEEPT